MKKKNGLAVVSTRKISGFWLLCLVIGLSTIFALSKAYAQTETDPILINALGSTPFSSKAVSLGYNHTCALTTTGGVKCWGIMISDRSATAGPGITPNRSRWLIAWPPGTSIFL